MNVSDLKHLFFRDLAEALGAAPVARALAALQFARRGEADLGQEIDPVLVYEAETAIEKAVMFAVDQTDTDEVEGLGGAGAVVSMFVALAEQQIREAQAAGRTTWK